MIHSVWPPADGNAEPKVARLRASHGAITATAATRPARSAAAAQPTAGLAVAPRSPAAVDEPGGGRGGGQQQAVHAGQGCEADERAGHDQPRARPPRTGGQDGRPDRDGPGGAEDREVVDGRVHDQERAGEHGQRARDETDPPRAIEVHAHPVGERHESHTQQHDRDLAHPQVRSEEGHGDGGQDRGERHPVAVARNGEHRVGRQLPAHLEERPQDRGREAVAGGQLLGHHAVVGWIGIRGIADRDRRHDAGDERRGGQQQQVGAAGPDHGRGAGDIAGESIPAWRAARPPHSAHGRGTSGRGHAQRIQLHPADPGRAHRLLRLRLGELPRGRRPPRPGHALRLLVPVRLPVVTRWRPGSWAS